MKKALGAVVLACVMVGGGFAASVALAGSHGSGATWSAGNCSGGAENTAARSKSITAVYSGVDQNGASCSITISGKFSVLPGKNKSISGFVPVTTDQAAGGYTGTIKTKTFHGTVTVMAQTITSGGCGWTYAYIGGHWVALYTTC